MVSDSARNRRTEEDYQVSTGLLLHWTRLTLHTCLEEIFGLTLMPPNNIYVILILGKNVAI